MAKIIKPTQLVGFYLVDLSVLISNFFVIFEKNVSNMIINRDFDDTKNIRE